MRSRRRTVDASSSIVARSWPSKRTPPASTRSRPATMLSSVDLPMPDSPITATNSPAASTRSSAEYSTRPFGSRFSMAASWRRGVFKSVAAKVRGDTRRHRVPASAAALPKRSCAPEFGKDRSASSRRSRERGNPRRRQPLGRHPEQQRRRACDAAVAVRPVTRRPRPSRRSRRPAPRAARRWSDDARARTRRRRARRADRWLSAANHGRLA